MDDNLNNMFRIVETHGNYGNSFHIEKQIVTKNNWFHKLFGYKPNSKWRRLTVNHYTCIVNGEFGYESVLFSYYNTYSAKKFLNLYIEYLKTKPVKYKGRTFKPMLYYGQQQYHFVYYDTKSYITDVKHNCGYSKIDKLSVLKREIDEREEEGQLVKIYNVV